MRVLMFLLLLVLVGTIKAAALAEVDAENVAEKRSTCWDKHPNCHEWIKFGECESNSYFMLQNCRRSCNRCSEAPWTSTTTRTPTVRSCTWEGNTVAVGGTYEMDCITYKCVSDGFYNWKLQIVSSRCQDHYGNCHSHGETFSKFFNGRLWDNCICSVNANFATNYKCSPPRIRGTCHDIDPNCPEKASKGECDKNPHWMSANCRLSCLKCGITCQANGKEIAEGETYEEDCITYKCMSDGFTYWKTVVVDAKCRDYFGVCHFPGETFTYSFYGIIYNNCQCTPKADLSTVHYSCIGTPGPTSNPGNGHVCLVDGKMYAEGETYVKDCKTYKCISDGISRWRTVVVSAQCRDYNGVCHSPGETFTYPLNGILYHNCQCTPKADLLTVHYSCIGTPNPTSNPGSGNGKLMCLVDGKMYAEGETYVKDCKTYKCISNGISRWRTVVISAQCRDYFGVCHFPGETFAYSINGKMYQNCQCTPRADLSTVHYSCIGTPNPTSNPGSGHGKLTCLVDGKRYAEGETYVKNCRTYECTSDGIGRWKTVVLSAQCKDANGFCRSPGETIPYVIDGLLWHNCQCTIGRDFTVHYSCQGSF